MSLLLSLLGSLLPTAAWLWAFLRHDHEPEPAWLLARTFLWGTFAWLVSAVLGASVGLLASPVLALVLLALVEEGGKLLAAGTAASEPDFDEPIDGLIYAVTAALGFALPENLSYGLGFGPAAALWHGVVTTLAHALFSAPLGYALTRRRFGSGPGGRWLAQGLTLSVLLHLAFNGLLSSPVGGGAAALWQLLALAGVLLLMWLLARRYFGQFDNSFKRRGSTERRGQG